MLNDIGIRDNDMFSFCRGAWGRSSVACLRINSRRLPRASHASSSQREAKSVKASTTRVPMLARMYERRLKGYNGNGYAIEQESLASTGTDF